jgi:protocatechuate 3,4-dioxygenase beta subunit
MLREDGGAEGAPPAALAAPDSGAARAPLVPLPGAQPADVARTAPPAPVAVEQSPETGTGVPASYARALGGLTGRILEARPDGEPPRPVPDFRVELVGGLKSSIMLPHDAIRAEGGVELQAVAASATTDVEGRFRMTGIDPRIFGALLLDPGGPRAMLHLLEQSPVSGETRDLGDIVLPLSVTLRGTVVDERGLPVEGARVRGTDLPVLDALADVGDFRAGGGVLIPSDATGIDRDLLYVPPPGLARLESRLPIPTAFTDAEGGFVLTGIPAGLVALVVDDGVHRPLVRAGVATGAPGGTRDVGRLAVADGRPLTVHVEDGDGEPVDEPDVLAGSVMPLAPAAVMKRPAERLGAGAVAFRGMADGAAWVAARGDPRHEYTLVPVHDVAIGTLTVTLDALRRITVQVRDTEGRPVPGARFLGRCDAESEVPDAIMPPKSLADRTRPGEEDGQYVIDDLSPGTWELAAFADGYAGERTRVDVDTTSAVTITLRRGVALRVRVLGAGDGAPVEWARVEAWGQDGPDALDLFEGPTTSARTDATGLAMLRDLPEGDVRVQVSHPAWAVVEERAEVPREDELAVSLPVGGSIAGRVTDMGGPPAEPLFIALESSDGEGDDELPRMTLSDEDGAFRFERVPPGEARLQARSRADFGGGLSFVETFINSPLARAEVTVVEGAEAQAELLIGAVEADVVTGWVRGVLVVNGQPAAGWRVRTWGAIRRGVTTDESGLWDLGRIEAGEVDLMLNAPGQSIAGGWTETRKFDLAQDERRFERIELRTGAVTGRVVFDATGGPASAAEVRLRSEGEQGGWTRQPRTMTSSDGSFRFEPVVVGSYRVTAEAEGYAEANSEPFELRPLELRSGVALRLRAGLTLAGRVRLEGAASAPRFVRLIARADEGAGSEGARVDLDDMRYRFTTLAPGRWTIHVATDLDTGFAPQTVELTRDVEDLELVFRPEPEGEGEGGGESFVYELR